MSAVSQGVWANLFNLYMAIALVVGTLVTAWTLYSIWRYRERPDTPRPADAPRAGYLTRERGHVLGAYVMAGAIAAIMFGLAFSTIDAINFIEIPPADEENVHFDVTGFQFGWQFRYYGSYLNETSGQQEEFSFTRVNDLRVPVDTVVTGTVTSRDVQHVFGIPEYRIQIYASPGMQLPIWFKATETGEIPIRCLRNCGVGHDDMIKAATLTVLTREEYDAFMAQNAPVRQAPAQETAEGATAARSLLLEAGQIILDEPTLQAGASVELKIMNRAEAERIFGVGPSDAPWATVTVPAGGEAMLTFEAGEAGPLAVWAKATADGAPEAVDTFEVVPQ